MNVSPSVLLDLILVIVLIGGLVGTSPKKFYYILVAKLSIQWVIIEIFLSNLGALVALVSYERSVEDICTLVDILLGSFSMVFLINSNWFNLIEFRIAPIRN